MRLRIFTRWQARSPIMELVKLFFTLGAIFLLAIGSWHLVKVWPQSLTSTNYLARIPLPLFESILQRGLPDFALQATSSTDNISGEALAAAVRVLASPLVVFPGNTEVNIFLTGEDKYEMFQPPVEESLPPALAATVSPPVKNPLVAIYNTHNAESYRASQGKAKFEGENGGVEQVAAALASYLSDDYGIPVVRSTTIHDYPDFALSYANSEKTLKKLLAENPSVLVALDIHRDAGLASPPSIEINNQQVAQVLLIVGSDARLGHPHWRQNETFARRLKAKMDKLYPGLCRGIRIQEGRYNQHLLPYSLLLEIGSDNNTLAEAERSACLVAKTLAIILEEYQQENPTT